MRLLHTSDWHLGINHGAVSRAEDQRLMLLWIAEQLTEHTVDTLVIAGDIFDSKQPAAQARRQYFNFLSTVGATGVVQVIIVGGNHDSPTGLDAPAELLGALHVHVIGGLPHEEADWQRCVVPLHNRAGEVCAVALAVPYVHEFRLGVRTTDPDHNAVRQAFQQRFGKLYSHLTDLAKERWPNLPIVATGHLTMGPCKRDDYPREIHQVGAIHSLPETILDSRIQYTALGHIHSAYPVGPQRRAWYSGSPIAYSLHEANRPRRVLLVDLNQDPDGDAEVTPLAVPVARALLKLRGDPDALIARISGLSWSEPLPPLLFCCVVTDDMPTDLRPRIHDALAAFPEERRPLLAEIKPERATPLEHLPEQLLSRPLRDLDPSDVFAILCESQGLPETTQLQRAFADIAGFSGGESDELDAFIAATCGAEKTEKAEKATDSAQATTTGGQP